MGTATEAASWRTRTAEEASAIAAAAASASSSSSSSAAAAAFSSSSDAASSSFPSSLLRSLRPLHVRLYDASTLA